jgi:hypothetical protein
MKAYFNNLSAGAWAMLSALLVVIGYPVAVVVVPAVLRVVVPEVVRNVLSQI